MRRNHGDSDIQRRGEHSRIREIGAHHRQHTFATRVREERQPRFRHALPETAIPVFPGIDVLAVRQALHHRRALGQAALQFVERIRSGRVY